MHNAVAISLLATKEILMTADNDDELPLDELDIEAFTTSNPRDKKPPAKRYAFRVNKKRVIINDPNPTREEILNLAGFVPVEEYRLRLKSGQGDPVEIQVGQHVDLTEPGVERFVPNKLHVQDGLSERRDFSVPEDDTAFLNSLGLNWEAIDCGQLWIIVRGWCPPAGFDPKQVDIALDITSYPAGVIDMAYFSPAISRTNGANIPQADVAVTIDGRNWQRWSRHRVEGVNSWNPESDSIASHYGYMLDWFKRELER
jgi:Prokaryotic E2 family E/Multiubiquitin